MNWEFNQMEADRVQQFRECIECFLCVNTCHVLRDHALFDEFAGPRNLVRLAQYEMHPLDIEDQCLKLRKNLVSSIAILHDVVPKYAQLAFKLRMMQLSNSKKGLLTDITIRFNVSGEQLLAKKSAIEAMS